MELNQKLKELRMERNMTQQELAEKFFVSKQTICRWENGTRCPDLFMVKELAKFFELSLDELLAESSCREKPLIRQMFSAFQYSEVEELKRHQKRLWSIAEIIFGIYLAFCVLCKVQLAIDIPLFATVILGVIGISIVVYNLILQRKIEKTYSHS